MAPPFSLRTIPLGFVPVEPISEHDRRGTARTMASGMRGNEGMAGRDGRVRDVRARRGQSCYTVWEQPAAAVDTAAV